MTEFLSVPELLGNMYWKDKRFAYSGTDLIYIGVTRHQNAGTNENKWLVWKLTWSGTNLERLQGPFEGTWDNRAGLGW